MSSSQYKNLKKYLIWKKKKSLLKSSIFVENAVSISYIIPYITQQNSRIKNEPGDSNPE